MEALAIPKQETEVSTKATRRRYTAEMKRRILDEGDKCSEPGALGALLRREGVYSSSYYKWRRERDAGGAAALNPRRRGPKAQVTHPLEREVTELKRALAKAEARARRAEALVEVQKKISQLLGIPQPESDEVP